MRLVDRHDRVVHASTCRAGTRSRSPATTSARPARPPQQELAFTLKDGFTYVEQAIERGLDVDDFAPRLSLLLQRPHRLLRGDRQVPRGAPDLGARDARDLRRHATRASLADALPHPDRRRLADRPAAAEQHRPHRDRGARRRARRHPVAAHQLLRRGARAADRGGGADRAAHAAGDRPRDRRHQHDRPARRLLLRRGAHRRDGARRPTSTSPGSTSSAGWSRRSSRTSRSARSPTPPSATSRRSTRGERIVVGVNDYRSRTTSEIADPADRPGARAQADRAASRRPRARARRAPRSSARSPS